MNESHKVLDGVLSINEHINKMGDIIEEQEKSDSPDKEKWAEAVLEVFVAASVRVLALDATAGYFNEMEIEEDEIPAANEHVKAMLSSIQQGYQIMQSMFMMSEDNDLGVEFNDETISPILKTVTEEHFDTMLADLKGI